jgi:hypothetical protein
MKDDLGQLTFNIQADLDQFVKAMRNVGISAEQARRSLEIWDEFAKAEFKPTPLIPPPLVIQEEPDLW